MPPRKSSGARAGAAEVPLAPPSGAKRRGGRAGGAAADDAADEVRAWRGCARDPCADQACTWRGAADQKGPKKADARTNAQDDEEGPLPRSGRRTSPPPAAAGRPRGGRGAAPVDDVDEDASDDELELGPFMDAVVKGASRLQCRQRLVPAASASCSSGALGVQSSTRYSASSVNPETPPPALVQSLPRTRSPTGRCPGSASARWRQPAAALSSKVPARAWTSARVCGFETATSHTHLSDDSLWRLTGSSNCCVQAAA
jgi:hypothetical protein